MVESGVFILFIKTVLDRIYEGMVIDHLAIGRPENTRARKIELRDLQITVGGRCLHVESRPL
jgi:hypothetical protein